MSKKARQPESVLKEETTHPVEWVVGIISALMVLGLLAFLLYDALFVPSAPPRFTYSIGQIERAGGTYRVPVAVINSGGQTAAAVRVRGILERNGETAEISEIEFDYLPKSSTRRGAFFFGTDPDTAQLRIMVTGYDDP